jgi:hypothetical protein
MIPRTRVKSFPVLNAPIGSAGGVPKEISTEVKKGNGLKTGLLQTQIISYHLVRTLFALLFPELGKL